MLTVYDKDDNLLKTITYDSFGTIIADSNPTFKIPFGFAGRDTNLYGYVLGLRIRQKSLYGFMGISAYALWSFADKYLDDGVCENPDYYDMLRDAVKTGKNGFPVSVTYPGLGIGTSTGQAV